MTKSWVSQVAAHEGNFDTQLTGLFNQQCGFGEVAGCENRVRVLGFQVGELCGEVFVAGLVVGDINHAAGASQFFKGFFEEFGQTYRVVIGNFLHDSHFLGAFLESVVSHNGALERIDAGTLLSFTMLPAAMDREEP